MKDEGRRMESAAGSPGVRFRFILGPSVVLGILLSFTGIMPAQETQTPPRTQENPQRDQRILVDVNLVTLRFTIRDQQGRFLNTLTRDQFRVFENQEQKEMAFFEAPSNKGATQAGPLFLAFLLDVSGSTFATRSEEIIAAQTFFDNIHQVTQLGIFGFTDKLIPFQDFTSERGPALKAFAEARQHLGQTAIYDSLSQLMDRMGNRAKQSDRKVVILVSDAMDKAYAKWRALAAKAKSNNITIYTILVPSAAQLYIGNAADSEALPSQALKAGQEEAFARLALDSGGKSFAGFETILDFDQTLAQIDDDIYGNLYSVGFYTDNPYLDKTERQIRVETLQQGAKVSALFQNLPERLSQKKKYISALFDAGSLSRLSEATGLQFEEIGAELDVLPSDREGGQLGLPFRIKISPFSLRGSRKEGVRTQFGIIGLLLDRQGREVVRLREFFRASLSPKEIEVGRAIIYTNKLFAPPGRYDLRLAVLELASWRVTAFQSPVEIVENR
ncbi:MAG: VWA domain-containing protein [Acidobacteria bacterium]|nr:MAG: VWA domain-containing protein [Acidobacteriota bacterium]